jgi:hypothetical protein
MVSRTRDDHPAIHAHGHRAEIPEIVLPACIMEDEAVGHELVPRLNLQQASD